MKEHIRGVGVKGADRLELLLRLSKGWLLRVATVKIKGNVSWAVGESGIAVGEL